MPLILIPLGVILLAALALATAVAAVEQERARAANPSFSPLSILKNVLTSPAFIPGWVAKRTQQKISEVISRYAGAKLGALTTWFGGLGTLVHGVELTLLSYAATVADALEHTITVTLPHEIRVAVRPVGRTARQALRLARSGRALARRALAAAAAAAALARSGLIRLGHRVDGLAAAERWARSRIRALTDRIGSLAGRLSKVEKAVSIAALTGVVVRVLARRFPWLFCRRVNRIGRQACGIDADLMESLLADTLLIAGTISIIEFARSLQGVTGVVTGAISGFVREA